MENYITIKPGEIKERPTLVSLYDGYTFPVEKDDGVLLLIQSDTSGTVTIEAGDSVLAGGNKYIHIGSGSLYQYVYLEAGRFTQQVDGKSVIRVSADYQGICGAAIMLG